MISIAAKNILSWKMQIKAWSNVDCLFLSTEEAELDSTAGSSACRSSQKANKRLASVSFLLSLELGCFFLKLDWSFCVLHFCKTEVVLKDNQFLQVITRLILLIFLYFLQHIKKATNRYLKIWLSSVFEFLCISKIISFLLILIVRGSI